MPSRCGAGTVECLLSLVLFAIVALGLTHTIAGSLRLQRGSDRAGTTILLALETVDSLRRLPGSRGCGAVAPGGGGPLRWQVLPESAGVAVSLLMQPLGPLGTVDTMPVFLPC